MGRDAPCRKSRQRAPVRLEERRSWGPRDELPRDEFVPISRCVFQFIQRRWWRSAMNRPGEGARVAATGFGPTSGRAYARGLVGEAAKCFSDDSAIWLRCSSFDIQADSAADSLGATRGSRKSSTPAGRAITEHGEQQSAHREELQARRGDTCLHGQSEPAANIFRLQGVRRPGRSPPPRETRRRRLRQGRDLNQSKACWLCPRKYREAGHEVGADEPERSRRMAR